MTDIVRLERASKTAQRQLNAAIASRMTHKQYLPKLRRSNRINRALTAIKMGEYDKQMAERREAAQALLDRIAKPLTKSERVILQPYTSLSL